MTGGRQSSQGTVRVVVRKAATVTPSRDTNGEDLLESENEPVDEDDHPEGAATIDMTPSTNNSAKCRRTLHNYSDYKRENCQVVHSGFGYHPRHLI